MSTKAPDRQMPDLLEWAARQASIGDTPKSGCPQESPRDTRKAAFNASRKWAGGLQTLCLRKLSELGEGTTDEVAEALGKSILAIRPRFSELNQAGEIRDTGKRRPARHGRGRPQVVWTV